MRCCLCPRDASSHTTAKLDETDCADADLFSASENIIERLFARYQQELFL